MGGDESTGTTVFVAGLRVRRGRGSETTGVDATATVATGGAVTGGTAAGGAATAGVGAATGRAFTRFAAGAGGRSSSVKRWPRTNAVHTTPTIAPARTPTKNGDRFGVSAGGGVSRSIGVTLGSSGRVLTSEGSGIGVMRAGGGALFRFRKMRSSDT